MLVAGGGVAALEACLFLRAYVTENDVDIDLLAPNQVFSYRPLSVLESFGGARAWSMPLDRFAADQDVTLVHDALGTVLGPERAIVTTSGVRCPYDLLLVAIGARPTPQLAGAITFQGSADAPLLSRLLDDASDRLRPRIAFAVGPATSWPLPLYELALLTAGELRARGARCEITLVTPEAAPLELFGARASAVVAELLEARDVTVIANAEPLSVGEGELRLVDGRTIGADRVVSLPRAAGRFVEGLPHDHEGFIPVDPTAGSTGWTACSRPATSPRSRSSRAGSRRSRRTPRPRRCWRSSACRSSHSRSRRSSRACSTPAASRPTCALRWATGRRRPRAPRLFALVAAEQDRGALPVVVPHRARGRAPRPGDPPGVRRGPRACRHRRGRRAGTARCREPRSAAAASR